MKKTALFILYVGFAASAGAQQVINVVPEKAAQPAVPVLTEAEAAEAAKAERKARFADRNCLRHTGSRLLSAEGNGHKCAIGNGRAYTREDLERTGGMDLGSALRSLHPGIH